jgi:proteasome assembly chaperone (PAC2) family protein
MKEVSRYEYFVGCVASGLIAHGETSNLVVDVEAYATMLEKHCQAKDGTTESSIEERKEKSEAVVQRIDQHMKDLGEK